MSKSSWQSPENHLNEVSLKLLADGRIPAIHLAEFASVQQCRMLCSAIKQADVRRAAASTSPMTLIGSNFSNSQHLSKNQYFKAAQQSWTDLDAVTSQAGYHPLEQIVKRLTAIWPATVEVATEPGYGRYFAGGIKTRVAGSALHFDYVPVTKSEYRISSIVDQMSWNLYLDVPEHCGSTTIFNSPIAREEPRPQSVYWNNQLPTETVEGSVSYTFRPRIGEVVLINTRYPHSIDMENVNEGEWRAQTGSFIGRLPDEKLVLWS